MKTHIIFDFDGVIADSFESTFSIAEMQWPKITREEYNNLFMGNYFDSLQKITTPPIPINFDEEYEKINKPLIDGMRDVIVTLAKNHKLYIVSSSNSNRIKSWLVKHGMENLFEEILGNEIKSKIDKIRKVIEMNNKDDRYLFITDTVGDIIEAKEARIPEENIVAVTWGFHRRNILEKYTKNLLDKPEDILVFINQRENK